MLVDHANQGTPGTPNIVRQNCVEEPALPSRRNYKDWQIPQEWTNAPRWSNWGAIGLPPQTTGRQSASQTNGGLFNGLGSEVPSHISPRTLTKFRENIRSGNQGKQRVKRRTFLQDVRRVLNLGLAFKNFLCSAFSSDPAHANP
jgi:hypothetical protein